MGRRADRMKTECNPMTCWSTKSMLYRYFAMINLCIVGLGGFICFDSIGSLQEVFMQNLDLSSSDFSLTYSVSSWPNIVLCFFGGFLIDRLFGVKLGTIVYAIVSAFGHFIFSLGTLLGLFWLVLVGRFIFGIGMEVMFICLQCSVIIWFKGKELSMVICLMVSISRLGTSLMYEIAAPLYASLSGKVDGKQAVGIVYFIVGVMTLVSITFATILKFMDPKKEESPKETELGQVQIKKEEKKISFRDILRFPITYWIIVLEYAVFTTCIFVLVPFTQMFFMTHFGMDVESANSVTSFFSILSAVIAPFLGILVDRTGRTVFVLIGGMANIALAHLLLDFSQSTSPYVGMFFMAVGFALLVSATSPMLSFIIPEYQLGTAFGVSMSLVNIAYTVNLQIAGAILDKYDFFVLELYMISWSILGLIFAIILWCVDKNANGLLNMSPAQRRQYEETLSKNDEAKQPLKG